MQKKALQFITPFTILVIILACMGVFSSHDGKLSGEAKAMFTVSSVVIIIPAIVLDIVLRLAFNQKKQWLWVTEAILFLIFCFVFIKK